VLAHQFDSFEMRNAAPMLNDQKMGQRIVNRGRTKTFPARGRSITRRAKQ
jgi:hypothetical protein